MKISLTSDLHVEFEPSYKFVDAGVDVVVFAGDVGEHPNEINWINENAPDDRPVICVTGNHSRYNNNSSTVLEQIKKIAKPNVHFLENEEIQYEGVRFLGATLWTDFSIYGYRDLARIQAARYMNDYRMCAVNDFDAHTGEKFTRIMHPSDTLKIHKETVDWLKKKLIENFEGPTVVVTHHAPSGKCIQKKYGIDNPINAAYASNLEHMMGKNVDVWMYGHMHQHRILHINGTRVICNAKGYRNEVPEFDPEFMIEVNL
ncbi:MAG: hypothetical protein F4X92_11415 [Gammaproteobacteria bacterium]|nr:hypothetical protein [Gammaproteobacteria bacterium]